MNLAIVKIINACSRLSNFSRILDFSPHWNGKTIVFHGFDVDFWTDKENRLYSIRRHKTNTLSDEFWFGRAESFNGSQRKNDPYTTANCKVFNGYIMAINGQPVNDNLTRPEQLLSFENAQVFNAICLALNIKFD